MQEESDTASSFSSLSAYKPIMCLLHNKFASEDN